MTDCAVILGSDKLIGTHGTLSVEKDGKTIEFLRVREVSKPNREGSFLAVDVDIKDKDGRREIKLAKNNPVVMGIGLKVSSSKKQILITGKMEVLFSRLNKLSRMGPSIQLRDL